MNRGTKLSTGSLLISIDVELAWGRIATAELREYLALYRETRGVTRQLLELFEAYEVPATWAFVGALMSSDERVIRDAITRFHPSVDVEAILSDPILGARENSLLSAPDLVEAVRRSPADHEIGSHSFSHILFDRANEDDVHSDLEAAALLAERSGVAVDSFIYPRNRVGHQHALCAAGFRQFRGPDATAGPDSSPLIKRAVRQLEIVWPLCPATVVPSQVRHGLIDLPGSMLFRIPYRGWKRRMPFSPLVSRALKGIERAIEEGRVLHLWFHPFNFAYRREEHFDALKTVLESAAAWREEDRLKISSMRDVAKLTRGPT